MQTEFSSLFRDLLLNEVDVSRLSAVRRSAALFSQGDKADAVFYISEGLIKLTRTNSTGGRLILSLYGPDDLVGEEALSGGSLPYQAEAEVLSPSIVFKVPWLAIERVVASHPELNSVLLRHLLDVNLSFTHKVELLSLQDVEARILYHLEHLAKLVKPKEDETGYPLPITQLELADLVGATRETVSTALKQLERRGFVKLSRRLLTVFPPTASSASAG